MIDLIVKLLIVMFALFVGGCFAFWPQKVGQHFDRWRGPGMESAEAREINIRKVARDIWLRQIGVLLIALAAYTIYLWIRMG